MIHQILYTLGFFGLRANQFNIRRGPTALFRKLVYPSSCRGWCTVGDPHLSPVREFVKVLVKGQQHNQQSQQVNYVK